MDLFNKSSMDLTAFRCLIQSHALEGPWESGRKSIHVLMWCKKSPTGENIGLMMKCERVNGTPAPVVLTDLDTAKKYLFLVREEVPKASVFLCKYEPTEANKCKWPEPDNVKVLVLSPKDVAGVKVTLEYEQTLSDEFSENRSN